jgi:hypothetical protein
MTLANATPNILKLVADDGTLPAYAWPGGYPLFYIDEENNVLCPDCANKNDEFDKPIVAADANWEDPDLYCDHCSARIESAYAEPEGERHDHHP